MIPVIMGPTGIGKSSLAMKLATAVNGEIISCDSRQIYSGMDIGTAKPTSDDLQKIPHHLIDILDPSEEFSAGRWAVAADEAIHNILNRKKIPIICGGTFFYFSALRDGFDITTTPDIVYRKELIAREKDCGVGTLHADLLAINPDRANEIHPHDSYRLIRALQIAKDGAEEVVAPRKHPFYMIHLTTPRELLYDRINHRVDTMVENGLYNELQTLLKQGYDEETPGLKCVGYREFFNYIDGAESFDESVGRIKQSSRKYAKRQLTWLRNRETADCSLDRDACDTMLPQLIRSILG